MAKKILVVDDDPSTLKLAEGILKSNNYDVVLLDFPKKILKVVKDESPDLVLLDVLMPYMDGYQACKEIKDSFGENIRIIMATSQSYEKDLIMHAYKEFGADDYILKPYNEKLLLEKLKKFLV